MRRPDTQTAAYHDKREKPRRCNQRERVLQVIKSAGRALTLAEIARRLSLPDSTVSGRLNELRDAGIVENYMKRKCSITARLKLTWYLAPEPKPQQELFGKEVA